MTAWRPVRSGTVPQLPRRRGVRRPVPVRRKPARVRPEEGPHMRALVWHGKHDIRCDSVPDPKIEHPRDAIVKVTSCAICGSDLHLYDNMIPAMERGDI